MQGQTQVKVFSDDYKEQCFEVWYALGRPYDLHLVQDAVQPTPEGNKPSIALLRNTRDTYGWIERADAMDSKAIEKVEHMLIDQKADMLKHQAEQARQIADLAKQHLIENGFDTASSAVNALKWATEEERTTRGVSEMLIKVSKMTPDELMQEAAKLLKRNNESVDAEIVEDDADSSSTTSD